MLTEVPVALAAIVLSVPRGSLVRPLVAAIVLSVPRLGVNSNDKSKHLRRSSRRYRRHNAQPRNIRK